MLTYCLFVSVVYTGTDGVVYNKESIYLDGYLWRKKRENGYLMKRNGYAIHPILAHIRYVLGTFWEHSTLKSRKFMYSRICSCVFDCALIDCSHFLCVLGMLLEHR